MGRPEVLKELSPEAFIDDTFGLPTVKDILTELEKPGRDPRPEFKTATFREGVETLADLHPGMILEGVVTNVAAFGAFVDIGVHQDGLVHVSALANTFVKDPHTIVKPGQIVKVKVLEVDAARQRINLTMRLEEKAATPSSSSGTDTRPPRPQDTRKRRSPDKQTTTRKSEPVSALALALARAREKK